MYLKVFGVAQCVQAESYPCRSVFPVFLPTGTQFAVDAGLATAFTTSAPLSTRGGKSLQGTAERQGGGFKMPIFWEGVFWWRYPPRGVLEEGNCRLSVHGF